MFKRIAIFFALLLLTTIPAHAGWMDLITVKGNTVVEDRRLDHAVKVIYGTYGHNVSIDAKNKDLIKFGRNSDLGTSEEMVWLQGDMETLPTTNAIDKFSSSNSGDTQAITLEGHTIDGTDLTFVVQQLTLAGQTETALTTPLARATRVYNNSGTDLLAQFMCTKMTL